MQTQVNPLVSVIILNFNGEEYIEKCLDTVLRNSYPNFEVLLVDNASTDQSLRAVQDAFGSDNRLRIIKNETNMGFSGGNNVGFAHTRGKYIVFLNNDTEVDPDWLINLVNALEEDPSIGLAQSKILGIDGEKIQTAGWLFSNYLVQKQALGQNKDGDVKFGSVFEVPVASGACMIVRRALVDEIGLFDSTIPYFYDDTLLSFKVWLADKRVVTVQNSRIRHILGATRAWNRELLAFNLLKAKICLMFDVYYKFDELAKAVFVNFFNTQINFLFALKKHDLAAVKGHMRAFSWAVSHLRYLWTNRINHWSKTKISSERFEEKFFRVNLPVALFLVPSKLSNDYFASAVRKYERAVMQQEPLRLQPEIV